MLPCGVCFFWQTCSSNLNILFCALLLKKVCHQPFSHMGEKWSYLSHGWEMIIPVHFASSWNITHEDQPRDQDHSQNLHEYCIFAQLVSWCFEPSQPLGIISKLNTNFNPSFSFSAHKLFTTNHNTSAAQFKDFTTHIHFFPSNTFLMQVYIPVKKSEMGLSNSVPV